jgi:NADPH:quinone reductase-like Zn-dependent oxidoreductase
MLLTSPRTTFAASIAPEWWLGLKARDKLYCTEAELDGMLVQSGFSGIHALIPDTVDPRFRETNIVMARAETRVEKAENSLLSKGQNQGIVIITDGKTTAQQTVARRLQSAIKREYGMNAHVRISVFAEAITTGILQGQFCLSLLDYRRPFFTTLTPTEFELFKQALSMADGFLWVSGGVEDSRRPEFHLVDGLARALRSENSLLKFVRLTVADADCEGHVLTVLKEAMTATSLDNTEFEYEERDGVLQISRVVQSRHMNRIIGDKIANRQHRVSVTLDHGATPLQIRMPKPGEGPLFSTPDGILLEEVTSSTQPLKADEILIRVHALGISHHDYLIASGHLNSTDLVSVCAGVIHEAGASSGFTVGERVLVSYTAAGCTWLKCPASSAVLLPPHVSFATAAAVLAEGLPAVYALYHVARLEEGDTVLVLSADGDGDGSGAVRAAVLAAEYAGANVVVASGEGDGDHSGVDAVLNYDSSSVEASLDTLAPGGIFVNMSAGTVLAQHCVQMAASKSITLATIDVAQIPRQRPARIQKLLRLVVSIYLQAQTPNGFVTTDNTQGVRVYKASELSTALESLKGGHDSGTVAVAVDVSPGQTVSVSPSQPAFSRLQNNLTLTISRPW